MCSYREFTPCHLLYMIGVFPSLSIEEQLLITVTFTNSNHTHTEYMGRSIRSMPTEIWLEMTELSFYNLLLTNINGNTDTETHCRNSNTLWHTVNWEYIAAEFDPKKTCLLMDAAKETII